MSWPYPDRKLLWPDGTEIPAELRDLLLSGLDEGFEIEHGEFAWNPDGSLRMKFRLCIRKRSRKGEIWDVELCYQHGDVTAVHPDAGPEDREWFTMMVKIHLTEWWETGASVVTARRRK